MSGEEERLYARAEMLDETGELAQAIAGVLHGAQGAGVGPRAVISLTAALQALDPAPVSATKRTARKTGGTAPGNGSDGEFPEALSDPEDQVRERLREVEALREQLAPRSFWSFGEPDDDHRTSHAAPSRRPAGHVGIRHHAE